MRGNIKALDLLHDPRGAPKTADMILADKIGYWFHEGSQKAQEEGLTPVLFFHGISCVGLLFLSSCRVYVLKNLIHSFL